MKLSLHAQDESLFNVSCGLSSYKDCHFQTPITFSCLTFASYIALSLAIKSCESG
jgi:hypothetical protein